MSQNQNELVLGYWDIRGLGHPIRFMLKYLEVDFTDKVYPHVGQEARKKWHADRDQLNMDFPNLPYLLDGDKKVTESRAVMKYICRTRKPEMLGKTVEIQTKVDMVDSFLFDFTDGFSNGFYPMLYFYTKERHEEYKKVEPVKLGRLSNFMKDNKWITGDDLTYIDFFLYEILYGLTLFDSTSLDKFDNLKGLMTRFEDLPQIKQYMNEQSFIKAPLFMEDSAYKI